MALTEDTTVRLVVKDDDDHVIVYDRTNFLFGPAGENRDGSGEYWVPWKIARHFLGDPYALDTAADGPEGTLERKRLWLQFGCYHDSHEQWMQHPGRPEVEVYNMAGERIEMAGEKPVGETHYSGGLTADDMTTRVQMLEAQLELLRSNLSTDAPTVLTETSTDPADSTTLDALPQDTGAVGSPTTQRKRVTTPK